tara:strand:- start:12135 stop:14495 length:2361 start_codon:yes stop_codon:yes gene_type:complete
MENILFKTFSKKPNSIKMNFIQDSLNYSLNNNNNNNNNNNFEDNSIKKIILLTTNYTLSCANNLLEYFKNLNIETLLIVNNKLETHILNNLNENNTYLFLVGINHIQNINNLNLSIKLINKIIIYQIEQLNQNNFVYNQLSSNVINIMKKCYALFDYSKVNINYYPEELRENVKLLSPLIKCEENNENSENIELFSKQFVSNIINNAIENYEKNITILFIGTLNERRTKILDALKKYNLSNNLNYNIVIVSNVFNNELVQLIKKSKIIINLHYFYNAILELFRIHDILSYNCKILSEIPGNYEELELIEKYSKVISFFPVINDDLSNINKMYESINENLKNKINYIERNNFIKQEKDVNKRLLKNNLKINTYKIIVSRYNENIDWTKNFNNVIIYNKGTKLNNYNNIIELNNVGREGHTYYKYIYDNYDNLPDYVIFLQGHPFDHSPNLYKNLNNIIDKNNFKNFEWLSELITKDDLNGNPNHPGLEIGKYYEKVFNKKTSLKNFIFGCGAQFIVSKKLILKNTKDFYSNIIKSLDYSINPSEVYSLERLHELIFSKFIINENYLIFYNTDNYLPVTNIFKESLYNINVDCNLFIEKTDKKIDILNSTNCDTFFQSEFWYKCILNKILFIKKTINNLYLKNYKKLIIVTDCDIQFFYKNRFKWIDLEEFIEKTNNDIYFIREIGHKDENYVNGGFYIIKNLNLNIINFFNKLYTIFSSNNFSGHGDQDIINELKHEINYNVIPNKFIVWATNINSYQDCILHHCVCTSNINNKIIQLNYIRNIIEK